jgi:hypothetical protein
MEISGQGLLRDIRTTRQSCASSACDPITEEDLHFRDMTNKIMHSSAIEWKFSDPDQPIIICHSDNCEHWIRAEIRISALAALCGGLMS